MPRVLPQSVEESKSWRIYTSPVFSFTSAALTFEQIFNYVEKPLASDIGAVQFALPKTSTLVKEIIVNQQCNASLLLANTALGGDIAVKTPFIKLSTPDLKIDSRVIQNQFITELVRYKIASNTIRNITFNNVNLLNAVSPADFMGSSLLWIDYDGAGLTNYIKMNMILTITLIYE